MKHGRCIDRRDNRILVRNETGITEILLTDKADEIQIGDLVWFQNNKLVRATAQKQHNAQSPSPLMDKILDPRRLHATEIRIRVEGLIREFFFSRKFRETPTPTLVPCPGMEPHIRPFAVTSWEPNPKVRAFLPTSPEFAMKRLLVGGLEKIFQICPVFRDEPPSTTHHPQFSMLEFYRAYAGYEEIMEDTEELFAFIAKRLFGKEELVFQNERISVATPWPRLRVRDLFQNWAGINLLDASTLQSLGKECKRLGLSFTENDTWDDLYFRIWLNLIEPKLPKDRAVFVTRYPVSQAALSVIDQDPDGSSWARRFEVYAGGLELGNAFEELTDPIEQRRRFVEDMNLREKLYGTEFPKNPLDEGFLSALEEGMPPSGGIAIGVDRMVMLFANEPDIQRTIWLP